MPTNIRKLAATMLVLTLLLIACGSEDEGEDPTPEAPAETTAPATSTPSDATSTTSGVPATDEVELSDADEEALANKPIPDQPGPTQPPNPTSSFDSDGDGFYTNDELTQAVRHRFPEYEWPSNFDLTADDIINAFTFPVDSMFEAPGEYTVIGRYHTCAWEVTLLNAVREFDQELIDESLYQLVDFGQSQNPLSRDENGKAFMREMYNSVVLGDSADLQSWVNNNCEFVMPYFEDAEATVPASLTRRNIDRS